MTAGEARELAREWAVQRARELPDFAGAYLVGSICLRKDADPFPNTSDVDVRIAVTGPGHDALTEIDGEYRAQAIEYKGLDMETEYPSIDACRDHQATLGSPELAIAFRSDNILVDPAGILAALHNVVRASYAEERWVRARCANQQKMALWGLEHAARLEARMPGWPDEFVERIGWLLFPGMAGAACIPSVADLGGPTFRRSLANCGTVLEAYGLRAIFGRFLEMLGLSGVTKQQAAEFATEMEEAFEQAVRCRRTRCWSSFLFQPFKRPKMIAGARQLISEGSHREAMLSMAVTRTMAQNVLENDASPPLREAMRKGYRRLLSTFGIGSEGDIGQKAEEARKLLPEIMSAAEAIISRNPDVVRS